VASLRKYPKMLPPPKGPLLTADRTLLAAFIGLVGFGAVETNLVSIASNDAAPTTGAPVMTATSRAPVIAARPVADYTPVGSIDRAHEEEAAHHDLPGILPHGLRSTNTE
jgi:hypothetical protein